MKEKGKKSWGEIVANTLIVCMVLVGTMMFVNLPGTGGDEGLMSKLFIGFLGAIITVQIVPAVVMVAAMAKEAVVGAKRFGKPAVAEHGNDK